MQRNKRVSESHTTVVAGLLDVKTMPMPALGRHRVQTDLFCQVQSSFFASPFMIPGMSHDVSPISKPRSLPRLDKMPTPPVPCPYHAQSGIVAVNIIGPKTKVTNACATWHSLYLLCHTRPIPIELWRGNHCPSSIEAHSVVSDRLFCRVV